MSPLAPALPTSAAVIARSRRVRVATSLLLVAAGAGALAVLALRLALLPPLAVAPADPRLAPGGFYAVETGAGNVPFRWSGPAAAVPVPALAARQVYTLTLAAPRPAGMAAPSGVRVVAGDAVAIPALTGGWTDVAVTAPSQVGLENTVGLRATTVNDSFYPGPGDRRRLMVALAGVRVAPAPGPGGLIWPAPLLSLIALLLPALVWLPARRWGDGAALGAALLTVPLVGALAWLVPAAALPALLLVLGGALGVGAAAWLLVVAPLPAGLAPRLRRLPHGPIARGGALVAGFAGLAVLATWPLALHLGDAVPGWPGDNFAFLYKIWWVKQALLTHANLFSDPQVFYPFGFNFGRGEPTLPNTLPGALIALVWSDAAGYNLVLLGGFVLSGLGAYLLARSLGVGRPAALLAGVVFMLAPYRLGQAAGHLQMAATQGFPLMLYCVERTLQGRRWAPPLAGLCFALLALTAWYYALIGVLLLGGYLLLRLPGGGAAGLIQGGRRRILLAGLGFAGVAGCLILPGLLAAAGAAQEAPLTYSAKAADENSASLLDYLIPNDLQPLWGAAAMQAHADQNIIEDTLYLGLPALALAAVALARRPRRGQGFGAWIWAILGAGALLLSLGLSLRVLPGQVLEIGGAAVTLPGRWLFDWVPGFSSIRAYARFGVVVTLSVAMLAALGATRLLAWVRTPPARRLLAGALLAAVLFDFWSVPYTWGLSRVAPDAVAGWLAAQPPGAVIRLPLDSAIAGPPLYAGTAYGHPLAYGYETFEPPGFAAARPILAGFPSPAAFALLRSWHVRYAVVAASAYGADWPATRAYFAGLPDWSPVYTGLQPSIYDAPLWIASVRPELRDAFAPDELVVYALK